ISCNTDQEICLHKILDTIQVQAELVRRRKVHTGPNGQKRIYSGNNCFSQMVVCGECGELYRRVHWNNHGCKSIVWRCISRLEPSRAAMNCTSRTVKEDLLKEITVKAFNQIISDKDGFIRQMQENIAKAITTADTMSPDGIQARLDELQKELIKKANSKQDYDAIADEIFTLREKKSQVETDTRSREETRKRIDELQDFIGSQQSEIPEFDESLVQKLIQQITVYDDHITVLFKSGLKIDINA
ncbi:MAG: recombinase zinc beta ribbon domain-containing protein, partial [Bhargavaea sp.]